MTIWLQPMMLISYLSNHRVCSNSFEAKSIANQKETLKLGNVLSLPHARSSLH